MRFSMLIIKQNYPSLFIENLRLELGVAESISGKEPDDIFIIMRLIKLTPKTGINPGT
jgi:hypothetical protein